MATREDLQKLVGRMMIDSNFRSEMTASPTKAAKNIGITLTPEEEKAIKQNSEALMNAGAELDRVSGGAASSSHLTTIHSPEGH
jgi:hypothetical protein